MSTAMICTQVKQSDRIAVWGRPIPKGMRLGWTCDRIYCSRPDHMCLAEDRTANNVDYSAITSKVRALEMGESFECDRPLTYAARNKFRARLCHVNGLFLAVRSSKDGKKFVITRTGTWEMGGGSIHEARKVNDAIPVVYIPQRSNPLTRPHCQYLGMIAFKSMHREEVRAKSCSWKGCAFPASDTGECRRHAHFFEYKWSMEWRALGYKDIHPSAEHPTPLLSTMRGFEIQRSAELTSFSYKGERNKGEKLSKDWWEENVLKYQREFEARPVNGSFRVTREPQIQYMPESDAIPNKQWTGAFVLYKGWGKKKIRKSQRKRPAGWHGNHPEQKPRDGFTRDTLEDVPMWAPQANYETVADDFYDDESEVKTLEQS